jgi:hypothetical protein
MRHAAGWTHAHRRLRKIHYDALISAKSSEMRDFVTYLFS